jgi:chemotaxis protein CheX
MKEQDLIVFIDSATNYFSKMSKTVATIGIPHLKPNRIAIPHEYTGIIGITGRRKGKVYFSAPERLLKKLLLSIGENTGSKEVLSDLVGEVANTLAGNARSYFGSEFIISVPFVINNKDNIVPPPTLRCYVIPLQWNGEEASIVISLE